MSKFFFAVHGGQFGRQLKGGLKTAKKRDKIAKSIDREAGYVYYYLDGERRWCGYGYCRNMGAPFDGATAKAVQEAWEAAGV